MCVCVGLSVCLSVCLSVFHATIKVSTRAFPHEQCSGSEGAGMRRAVCEAIHS